MGTLVFFLKRRVFHNSGKLLSKRKENTLSSKKKVQLPNSSVCEIKTKFLRNLETSLDKVMVSVETLL